LLVLAVKTQSNCIRFPVLASDLELTFGSPVSGNDLGSDGSSPFMDDHVNQVVYFHAFTDF
jgi:hypothetical protein